MTIADAVVSIDAGLTIEKWSDQAAQLLIVPPLTWQASLFIHRRRLSLYAPPPPAAPEARPSAPPLPFSFPEPPLPFFTATK